MTGYLSRLDYSFLSIQHLASGINLPDMTLGKTKILIKDIDNFQVQRVNNEQKILKILQKFTEKFDSDVPKQVIAITFSTKQLDHNINWMAKQSLTETKSAAKSAAASQLQNDSVEISAIVATFNRRGRLNYRVTARTSALSAGLKNRTVENREEG